MREVKTRTGQAVITTMLEIQKEIKATYDDLMVRKGSNELWDFLLNHSDYFTAPASSKYHCVFAGGLSIHSWLVYQNLLKMLEDDSLPPIELSAESAFIITVFHDLCKTLFYSNKEWKWRKGEESGARWHKQRLWTVDDQIPLGHGERSLYMLQNFIRVHKEEALAIRHHLGYLDPAAHQGWPCSTAHAMNKYPLTFVAHLADMTTGVQEYESRFFYKGAWYEVPESETFESKTLEALHRSWGQVSRDPT